MSNSFGTAFRITTFGESHGAGLGVVVDGCPAGHPFPFARIAAQMARRRPGQGKLTSPRQEADLVRVLSGLEPDTQRTLGTPITMLVGNDDARSHHYDDLADLYRPSHADYTYDAKYGLRAVAGGGRASARETVGRVAAGALAEDLLAALHGVEIVAWVAEVADVIAPLPDLTTLTRDQVDASPVRCPDPAAAEAMIASVKAARDRGDSLGGVVTCVATGCPAGWGEPVFDKLEAKLAQAMLSIPATKGFEIGSGFAGTRLPGSRHNDPFVKGPDGRLATSTNYSGGIQGGISNGMPVVFRIAFKPPATISQAQSTATFAG